MLPGDQVVLVERRRDEHTAVAAGAGHPGRPVRAGDAGDGVDRRAAVRRNTERRPVLVEHRAESGRFLRIPELHPTLVVLAKRRGEHRPPTEPNRCECPERGVQLAPGGTRAGLQVPHLDAAPGCDRESAVECRQHATAEASEWGTPPAPHAPDRLPHLDRATVPGGGEAGYPVVQTYAGQPVDLVADVALRMRRLRETEHLLPARRVDHPDRFRVGDHDQLRLARNDGQGRRTGVDEPPWFLARLAGPTT